MAPVYSPTKIQNKEGVANEYLFYLSFFAYRGGMARNIGMVYPNPEYAVELLDYLVLARKYSPALFLKGLRLQVWREAGRYTEPAGGKAVTRYGGQYGSRRRHYRTSTV